MDTQFLRQGINICEVAGHQQLVESIRHRPERHAVAVITPTSWRLSVCASLGSFNSVESSLTQPVQEMLRIVGTDPGYRLGGACT